MLFCILWDDREETTGETGLLLVQQEEKSGMVETAPLLPWGPYYVSEIGPLWAATGPQL